MLRNTGEHPTITTEDESDIGKAHHVNSVDATVGQPMVDRVMARKQELEAVLAALPEGKLRERADIDLALNTINELLTGDLSNIPPVVVADMNRWLERHKHLAETSSPD